MNNTALRYETPMGKQTQPEQNTVIDVGKDEPLAVPTGEVIMYVNCITRFLIKYKSSFFVNTIDFDVT